MQTGKTIYITKCGDGYCYHKYPKRTMKYMNFKTENGTPTKRLVCNKLENGKRHYGHYHRRVRKCQKKGCHNYFTMGPGGRDSILCNTCRNERRKRKMRDRNRKRMIEKKRLHREKGNPFKCKRFDTLCNDDTNKCIMYYNFKCKMFEAA